MAEINKCFLSQVPETFRTPDVCLAAVQKRGRDLEDVPRKLRTLDFCVTAVQNPGKLEKPADILKSVPKALKEQVKQAAGIE